MIMVSLKRWVSAAHTITIVACPSIEQRVLAPQAGGRGGDLASPW